MPSLSSSSVTLNCLALFELCIRYTFDFPFQQYQTTFTFYKLAHIRHPACPNDSPLLSPTPSLAPCRHLCQHHHTVFLSVLLCLNCISDTSSTFPFNKIKTTFTFYKPAHIHFHFQATLLVCSCHSYHSNNITFPFYTLCYPHFHFQATHWSAPAVLTTRSFG